MRRLAFAFCSAVAAALLFGMGGAASAQTCDAPVLSVDSTSVSAGSSITVSGVGFDPACATGTGPHSPDVMLTLVQGDRTVELDTVRAGTGDPSFRADVEVPDDLAAGTATIAAQGAAGNATLPIQIRVSTPVTPGGTDGAPAPAEATGDDALADTGVEAAALVGIALALLLGGTTLEWLAQVLPARA